MPIAPLLQRFIDDELARAGAVVSRVLAGTLQLLGHGRDAELGTRLRRFGDAYERAFVASLRTYVLGSVAQARQSGDPNSAGDGLQLMDESRVEADIEISRAMQLIDSTAEWELRELQSFTSTLVGQTHVTPESNPFRPVAYATALWDAAGAVTSVPAQQAVLLRTSAGVAAGLLKNAWAAASTRLEAQGVEPGTYRTVVLPSAGSGRPLLPPGPARSDSLGTLLAALPGTSAASARGPTTATPASRGGGWAFEAGGGGSAELAQALARLGDAWRLQASAGPPAPASGARSAPTPTTGSAPATMPDAAGTPATGAAVMPSLLAHLPVLTDLAGSAAARQSLELVARVFDAILSDTQMPESVRPLFARLQVPALRVALSDAAARQSLDHVLWRLLAGIGEVAAAYPRAGDPRLTAFVSIGIAIADELAALPALDASDLQRALNRIDAFNAEQLRTQLRMAQSTVESLQLAERRGLIEEHLTARLTQQMAALRAPPAVRRFVTDTWAKVIARHAVQDGERSESVVADLKSADDLLWSLQIPDHPQSRQRLIALLPGLLQRLRDGMALVEFGAAERQQVFDELMAIHTEALRRGSSAAPAPIASSEDIVRHLRDEVVPPPRGGRDAGDSLIDLSSMDTVPVGALATRPGDVDDPDRQVDALRAGTRMRLFLHGGWNRVQLLWQSDRRRFFLFAGETPGRHHSITRRALERLAAAGLLQPHEPRSIVQRALEHATRTLTGAEASSAQRGR